MALQRLRPNPRQFVAAIQGWGASAAGQPWVRGVLGSLAYPHSPDDFLGALRPDWALDRVVARVCKVQHDTADTTSLYLIPSRNFKPHSAGQHVLLGVTLEGVLHTRSFSLSAPHRAGEPLRLTIKAHATGRVSVWARDQARVHDQVELSQPMGDFVLPEPVPERLWFVSGGSGLTPLLAMAQALVDRGWKGSLRWIHSERSEVARLEEMQAACAALGTTLEVHRTGDAGAIALLSGAALAARVPDYATRHLFVCGPRGLMDAARSLYAQAGLVDQVHHEDFQPRVEPLPVRASGERAPRLQFADSRRAIVAQPGASLLELAEQAGLHPPHGCRRGICHTCTCTKQRGTVRNNLTGAESDACNEEIRLCIHSPVTDVTLAL